MRTYDPADRIRYVHLGSAPAVLDEPAPPREECRALAAGYANVSLRDRIGPLRTPGRPALVLLSGGSAAAEGPVPVAPALRLAR